MIHGCMDTYGNMDIRIRYGDIYMDIWIYGYMNK